MVLYDGNPGHPDLGALWRLAERHQVTYFGTSAPFIQAVPQGRAAAGETYDLSRVRALGSTGAPLSVDGFRWIADAVGQHIQICSVSGGTDVCAAFLASAPTVPVWLGELSCAALGADVPPTTSRARARRRGGRAGDHPADAVDAGARSGTTRTAAGCGRPTSRTSRACGGTATGCGSTPRGSFVIYGRSDSTLNRGGVRMGTADFYAVVEGSTRWSTRWSSTPPRWAPPTRARCCASWCWPTASTLAEVQPALRRALRTELSPRHVPDRFVVVDAIPRTLNGKKCEVPVKKILAGVDPDKAVSRGALQNPEALAPFVALAAESEPRLIPHPPRISRPGRVQRRCGRPLRRCCRPGPGQRRRSSARGTRARSAARAASRPRGHAAAWKARTRSALSAVNAMCVSRLGRRRRRCRSRSRMILRAVADGDAEVHLPGEAQRGEHRVVERLRGVQVSAVDAEVVDHPAIVLRRRTGQVQHPGLEGLPADQPQWMRRRVLEQVPPRPDGRPEVIGAAATGTPGSPAR